MSSNTKPTGRKVPVFDTFVTTGDTELTARPGHIRYIELVTIEPDSAMMQRVKKDPDYRPA